MVATSNVGIGTSAPEYALDVHGTSNTGPLTVSSLTIADGAIEGDLNISGNLVYTSNTTTIVNSNVVVEYTGPHGRDPKEVPLKKYPEIVFDASKLDGNDTTNTYTQAGYTVTASSQFSGYHPWEAFDEITGNGTQYWSGSTVKYATTGDYGFLSGNAVAPYLTTVSDTVYNGEWIQLELPHKLKLSYVTFFPRLTNRFPRQGVFAGSNDGTNWDAIHIFSGLTTTIETDVRITTDSENNTTAYKYIRLVITHLNGNEYAGADNIKLYGYEEDPPAGDSSLDTTFTSVMNTPQTTGANVYVDAKLSTDFTNQVTGPTPTGTSVTHNDTGKYWELTGELTSNITVEANTFLEGDQPHAVSVWFNSSNLEANVSNTCVFSVSDQEKLDSQNLDLQSNTWHNLTYAYQGEGGSRVTYLDGRKVSEDQAEDTFGEYPPFAMTGYSQGGYVVSASSENSSTYLAWKAFDDVASDTSTNGWLSEGTTSGGPYNSTGYIGSPTRNLGTESGGSATVNGEYLVLKMPHKVKVSYARMRHRYTSTRQAPTDGYFYGSNNGTDWQELKQFSGIDWVANPTYTDIQINATQAYNRLAIVPTREAQALAQGDWIAIGELSYHGHHENDLVRLPDPTRVLKYPHIPLTGPAQRGYVFTGSSQHSSTGQIYSMGIDNGYLFDGDSTTVWHIETNGTDNHRYDGTDYSYGTDSVTNFDPAGINIPGEWVQLKFPHKLQISKVHIRARSGYEHQAPEDFTFYGSDTAASGSWSLIQSFTGQSPQDDGTSYYDITTNPVHYKYILMLITRVVGTTALSIAELQYYGTEEATSIPIQIGGGNIDKVANFRVYDKFVGEDQALEIWDAQKDEFGRAKSSMTLQKGRLGIGTAEPEGRLAVADEPDPDAYGLQEFPPKPLSDSLITHIEGHGIFKVYASVARTGTNGAVNLFDKKPVADGGSFWLVGNGAGYNTSSGAYEGESGTIYRLGSETSTGQYVTLEMPYPIKLEKYSVGPRSGSDYQTPEDWELWGSNDGSSWTKLHNVIGNAEYVVSVTYDAPQTNYYRHFGFVVTRTIMTGAPSGNDYLSVGELKLFGYREQVTKQSVLHDGQLTLTKSLTVPRIGPPLDADDTPRRDRLVVEYNTSTNPTFEGAVRDTSGRGNDGVFVGTALYDATKKAFEFDGNSDYVVSGALGIPPGAFVHSVSLWFKRDSEGSNMYLTTIAGESAPTNTRFSMMLQDSPDVGNIHLSIAGSNSYFSSGITTGVWFHVVYTYNGGAQGSASTAHTVYVNGVKKSISGGTGSGTLNLPENSRVSLGSLPFGGSNYLDGSISNFKLYDKILTAEEVKTLYDMGRCDEGHHVVNFSKTRVGIGLGDGEAPRSALDVRDVIYASSSTVETFTGQHKCVPEEPMEIGLIVSAKKNQYVKLNGSLDTGKSAITIDESLPVVSLSSVAKDKACFGVVSSMEEANSLVRIETVGGVISDAPKTLGDNRAIVNSVGEGAIWVVDTNGSLESGDYITTSNVAGYGQKQEDDVLHNYTVAKITMDCDFTVTEVPLQVIKREETGLRTITEDEWNTLVDYDRSSTTETQYSNTLDPEAYSGQSGYTPREVTTIVDYTDGSDTISVEEWSALSPEVQETYQSNTTTEIVEYIKFVTAEEWSSMDPEVQATYTEVEIITYYQIMRGENILDENGQLQWEDKTGVTEAPYERRFLDTDGVETDEANAAHIAAFVGCTYHCG
jgi:hypothetical protein